MGSVHEEDHTCLETPGAISVLKQLYSGFIHTLHSDGEGEDTCTRNIDVVNSELHYHNKL